MNFVYILVQYDEKNNEEIKGYTFDARVADKWEASSTERKYYWFSNPIDPYSFG